MATETMKLTIDLDAAQALTLMKSLQRETTKVGEASEDAAEKSSESWSQVASGLNATVELAQKAAQGFMSIARAAAENERTEVAIARLGSAWAQVEAATNRTMSAQQALAMQMRFTNAGMRVTGEELAVIAQRARMASRDTGNMEQAVEQLTDALVQGEQEGLQRFGLSVVSNGNRIRTLNTAVGQMREQLRGMPPEARTLAEEMDHTSRAFTTLGNNVGGQIARILNMKEALGDLADYVSGEFNRRIERQDTQRRNSNARFDALDAFHRARGSASQRGLRVNTGDVNAMSDAELQDATRLLTDRSYGGNPNRDLAQAQLDRMLGAQNAMVGRRTARNEADRQAEERRAAQARIDAERNEEERLINAERDSLVGSMAARARTQEAQRRARAQGWRPESSGGGGGGGGTRERPSQISAPSLLEQLQAMAQGAAGQFEAFGRNTAAANDDADRRRGMDDRDAETLRQRDERQRRAQAAERDGLRTMREQNDFGTQLIGTFQSTQTAAQMAATSVSSAWETMTGSFKAHLAAIITGKESLGEALRSMTHEVLLSLSTESAVAALKESAAGIASLAVGAVPKAGMHFTAAGIYAGVAVAAGVGAAVTVPKPAPTTNDAFGNSRAASVGGASGSQQSGGAPTYIINVNGTLVDREGFANAVGGAFQDLGQRGRFLVAA